MIESSVDKLELNHSPWCKIGLGGGCHWCTEGVFESLIGVIKVYQGWIAPKEHEADFSEAIEVVFDPNIISQHDLITIHLHTHAASSNHSMRNKYRSAVYVYQKEQYEQAKDSLSKLTVDFKEPIVTQIYYFHEFRLNKEELQHYFYTSPDRPFCQTYIHPKLRVLLLKFSKHLDHEKLSKTGLKLV